MLTESFRFTGIFALLMILPTVFLAWQALSSVRSEELALDIDLTERARATTKSIVLELDGVFERFERRALERLRNRESVSDDLAELSTHLRAAYRFDNDGVLLAPFDLSEKPLPDPPPAVWRSAARDARLLQARRPNTAADAWQDLYRSNPRRDLMAEALLGEAHAAMEAGSLDRAKRAVTDMLVDFADVRSRHGLRMGDVAQFWSIRIEERRGADADSVRGSLEDLADELLDKRQWQVGRLTGDPSMVQALLRELQSRSTPTWMGSARKRFNERYAQLLWTSEVAEELDNVSFRVPEEGQFKYLGARADSPGVWAVVREGEDIYAFSFAVQDLLRDLHVEVAEEMDAERDLMARLYFEGDEVPATAMSDRTLGEQLPSVRLAVLPSDPAGLAARKQWRRTVRIGVVVTAVFVSVMGAGLVGRMIAYEVEGARQRADFAANVSHELRSPITQIRLKGEALQLGLVDPGADMEDHFSAIVREAERLSRLVDNVLDFAAIERGAKRYQLRPDDIVPIVITAVESARSIFTERNMDVVLDVPDDLPPVWLDRDAMGQVMTNLLSNAAKYGGEGKPVYVQVESLAESVRIQVRDEGVGIVADELPKVFDDFFRSQDPAVRRRKGTGIGLAIVRYIVEAHGGTIRAESPPGHGATFIIDLPLEH